MGTGSVTHVMHIIHIGGKRDEGRIFPINSSLSVTLNQDEVFPSSSIKGGGGGVTPIGTVSTAATGVKIFDRRILALTT